MAAHNKASQPKSIIYGSWNCHVCGKKTYKNHPHYSGLSGTCDDCTHCCDRSKCYNLTKKKCRKCNKWRCQKHMSSSLFSSGKCTNCDDYCCIM
eukprot:312440_1